MTETTNECDRAVIKKVGRPKGIKRKGNYGKGVKTKVVRVPEAIADNIVGILKKFEDIRTVVDSWDEQFAEAAKASKTGKIPRTYDRAVELLSELRELLGESEKLLKEGSEEKPEE